MSAVSRPELPAASQEADGGAWSALLRWRDGGGGCTARRQGRPGERRCVGHRSRHGAAAGRRGSRGRGGRRVTRRRGFGGRGGGGRGRPCHWRPLRRPPRGVGRRLRPARHCRVRGRRRGRPQRSLEPPPSRHRRRRRGSRRLEHALDITTRGALLLARHAIPVMAAGGGGSVVTISSGTSTIGESTGWPTAWPRPR